MRIRTSKFVPKWILMLGLVWMMSHTNGVSAQRSSSGTFGNSSSGRQGSQGRQGSRSGTNRQSSLGLQAGGQTPLAGSPGGLGRSVEPGLSNAQPQGREFREQAFVGRDAQDVRDTFRNRSRGQSRRAMMDMAIENLNDMRESRRRWRDQQRQPPSVRIQLRPAFDHPGVSATWVAEGLQSRLTTILQSRKVASPNVELKGRTATLYGSVGSEHEKMLAGQLVAIEPGISKVENRLVVAGE
ncbi:MAG: BON domain-containing protein [Pirellulales bacterium]